MESKNYKKILLIEDNSDDVELTIHAFKKQKIINEIVVLRDGQEALDYLFCAGKYNSREKIDRPILILLDLNLPKIDGLQVLKKIREDDETKYFPVIVLTSSNEEKDIIQSYKLYANSYIRKPVDFIQFSDVVNKLCVYWQLNEPLPYTDY